MLARLEGKYFLILPLFFGGLPVERLLPGYKGISLLKQLSIVSMRLVLVLVFVFLMRAFAFMSESVAFVIALLFCVHPIHTSVVNDFGGRAEILGLLFFMLSFLQVLKWKSEQTPKHLIGIGLLAFLSLLSSPTYMFWFVIPVVFQLAQYQFALTK